MYKVLYLAVYPAPYRASLANALSEKYDTDVFYTTSTGDERNNSWFEKGNYHSLDNGLDLKFFNECKKNIKKYSLVVVMEFCGKESMSLLYLCRLKKVPYIFNCDGVMLLNRDNYLKNIVKKYLLEKAVAYLATGEHAKQYFLKYGAKEKDIYLHNFTALHEKDILSAPVKKEEKIAIRKKLYLPVEDKICIAVGRFIPLKRYDVLLRLWKQMPHDVKLLLIGGGPEKEKYEKIISDLNLSNVILDDFHPFNELLEYYKASDLFVHPTSYDVWGLIINEAMACGLPVVVTDTCVAGLELIKNGENGYVTHLGDDEEFISKVKHILENDDLREKMALNAIETIQPYYIENMIDSQIKTINKVLSENA